MITAAGSEPGPGGVSPGAVIRTGCADGGGGGQSKHRMGLGHGGPGTRSGLAVSLAEQPVRLSGKFLGTAVMLWSAHRCSTCLVVLTLGVIPRTPPGDLPYGGMPATATGPGTGPADGSVSPMRPLMSARPGEGSDDDRRPVQPDDRQGLYCPAWISRRLPVLTSYPAACQDGSNLEKAWPDLQAKILTDDLRLDLGATAESQQNPCCRQVRLAQASSAG